LGFRIYGVGLAAAMGSTPSSKKDVLGKLAKEYLKHQEMCESGMREPHALSVDEEH